MTMTLISRLLQEDEGQNLIEYALLAGLVALAAVVAVGASGDALVSLYNRIRDAINEIPGPVAGA
jgi:Flp pilus assembly pilin Flp